MFNDVELFFDTLGVNFVLERIIVFALSSKLYTPFQTKKEI